MGLKNFDLDKFLERMKNDPYGGKLAKTNLMLLIFIILSCFSIVFGGIVIAINVVESVEEAVSLNFSSLFPGALASSLGFVFLVVSIVFKAMVEKIRMQNYSSKHKNTPAKKIAPKQVSTEVAMKGKSTSENELSIEKTKASVVFCPHCKQKIPSDSKVRCPKCGKPLDDVEL